MPRVTMWSRVLHVQLLLGWTGQKLSRSLFVRVICQMRWLGMKGAKKAKLRDVKDIDNIWNICFALVNSGFPPCSILQSPYKKQGRCFPQILVVLSTSRYTLYMRVEIWGGKLYLLYVPSLSVSNWPVVKFPQHFLEILYFPSVCHDQ